EVPQSNVIVAGDEEQIHDDPGEPGGHQVTAEAGPQGNHQAGHDLDDADDEHRLMGVARHDVVDDGGKILVPVDENVEELVQPEQQRRDDEADAEEEVPLVGGVGQLG